MTNNLLKRTIDVLEQVRLTELMQIDDGLKVLEDLKREYNTSSYHFVNHVSFELPSLLQQPVRR